MTIREAIERTDSLIHNTYSTADKVAWLSSLDWDVFRSVMQKHENSSVYSFWGYDDNTDPETPLLVPEPYDQLYLRWLEAQIYYYNGESDRFNMAISLYNSLFESFAAHYTRTHMPKSSGIFLF